MPAPWMWYRMPNGHYIDVWDGHEFPHFYVRARIAYGGVLNECGPIALCNDEPELA